MTSVHRKEKKKEGRGKKRKEVQLEIRQKKDDLEIGRNELSVFHGYNPPIKDN